MSMEPRRQRPTKEFNKNKLQADFNKIKGKINEMVDSEPFCSIILEVGHERPRPVCLTVKKDQFDKFASKHKLGDRVSATFFITSRQKDGRWYTSANLLDVELAT